MRVLTAFFILLAASAAQASSIITVDQTQAELNSLVDYLPPQKTDPDVVVEGAKVLTSSPSIITLGTPAPASETEAPPAPAGGSATSAKQPSPVVMRGGLIGGAFPAPPPVPVATEPALLDPNDAGTPAKRRALKEQASRLQEAAESGAEPAPEPDAPEIVQEPTP